MPTRPGVLTAVSEPFAVGGVSSVTPDSLHTLSNATVVIRIAYGHLAWPGNRLDPASLRVAVASVDGSERADARVVGVAEVDAQRIDVSVRMPALPKGAASGSVHHETQPPESAMRFSFEYSWPPVEVEPPYAATGRVTNVSIVVRTDVVRVVYDADLTVTIGGNNSI